MPRSVLRALAATFASAFALAGLPAQAKDTTIRIGDNFFATPYVVVTVGDSVTWTNAGALEHTVRTYPDAPRSFDSSPGATDGNCTPLLGSADCIEPGTNWSPQPFRKAGTYKYYCKVPGHGDPSTDPDPQIRNGRAQPCGMCGIVVVLKKAKPSRLIEESESPEPVPPTTSASPSPSGTVSPTPSPTPSETSIAIGGPPVASGRSGGQLLLAFGAIVTLGGLGFVIWQRFLAPR